MPKKLRPYLKKKKKKASDCLGDSKPSAGKK